MTLAFTPPRVIPFQLDGTALAHLKARALVVWDTGLGKSALAMGASVLALEDDTDLVIIVCEPNKLKEWLDDVAKFTTGLTAAIYHGPPKQRQRIREGSIPGLQVLITTYETLRNDGASKVGVRKQADGPLLEWLTGKRAMVIYDEIAVLGRRGSQKYRAHQHVLLQLTKTTAQPRVLGLTATPIDTDYDNLFSVLRLIAPQQMPLVREYEKQVVAYRDRTRYWKPVHRPEGAEWFRKICAPLILRKRKTDADVREQFPPFSEKFVLCQMHADQRELYQRLEDLAWDDKGNYRRVPGLGQLLRQFICDPLALRYSGSELGKMIWEELQVELEKCTSAKAEELLRQLDSIVGNGHKAIVFTFYGQSVLRALQDRLASFQVHPYHGEMTPAQKDASKRAFLDTPGGRILLSSDAGARGINAPCAYIIEYEPARTPSLRTQRAGRGHRIDSDTDVPVTLMTFVTEDSLEDANAIPALLERNEMQDLVLGDTEAEGYTTADDRREMFARARKRKS